ncbi:hypothetical protein [Polyangium spumosum]|uniref:DUF2147 domain-containing protein n=1 Tax=Polyangium spumosum TaxID=889282 RepID=A0A6N7PV83_9BACT|nr:hypothetical protein [Polyangium spumosum]MRG96142.1 hypothetical protein [Polyangium spumosum]
MNIKFSLVLSAALSMLALSATASAAAPCTGIWRLDANNHLFDLVLVRAAGSTDIQGGFLQRDSGRTEGGVIGACNGESITFTRGNQQYTGIADGNNWRGTFVSRGVSYSWKTAAFIAPQCSQ